jgi:hypothetical protein
MSSAYEIGKPHTLSLYKSAAAFVSQLSLTRASAFGVHAGFAQVRLPVRFALYFERVDHE